MGMAVLFKKMKVPSTYTVTAEVNFFENTSGKVVLVVVAVVVGDGSLLEHEKERPAKAIKRSDFNKFMNYLFDD